MITYDYSGKLVMITGGASGIGLAASTAFAKAGARVAICDINPAAAETAAKALVGQGHDVLATEMDVADFGQVERTVDDLATRYGPIDVAINNAGIEAENVPLADLPVDSWRRVLDVNLSGVFYCMKAQIRHMLEGKRGVILNTASISGLIGGYNLACYTASKHGLVGLTRAAAIDYAAQGIRINALCPGLVDTPFIAQLPQEFRDHLTFGIPLGRAGTPEEMAQAMLWLCSDGASYVTGHAMVVDGATSLGGVATRFDHLLAPVDVG